jgi:regulatory protein
MAMRSSKNNIQPTPSAGSITAIRAQARDSQRVNLEINGEFAMGVSLDILAHEGLFVGQHLDDAKIQQLLASVAFDRAKQSALRLLEIRPRSQREIHERLRQRGFDADTITAVTARLSEVGLLDDNAFATYLVEQRQRASNRGGSAIRQDLRRHGIDSNTISIVADSHNLGDDDEAHALTYARKISRRLRGLDRTTFTRRLGGALQRRGFNGSAMRQAMQTVWQELQQGIEFVPSADDDDDDGDVIAD